jgi:hypothetical protein
MDKWVTFVGEGRSGHTVVSAILDSHPNCRISEEQKLISKWLRGWDKEKIFKELLESGYGKERLTKKLPGMLTYQNPLIAVGDKCGWDAVNEFKRHPTNILGEFSKFIGLPVKVIHTSRNPYDNIGSWMKSPKYQREYRDDYYRARMLIRRYSRFYDRLEKVIKGQDVFHLRNEDLIEYPVDVLKDLCFFIGLDYNKNWSKACRSILHKEPHRWGTKEMFPGDTYDMIRWRIIDRYSSLEYYR